MLQNPLPGRRGTLGRSTIELPGTWSFDANMSKSFRLTERKSLQLRIDATNVLNHPSIGTPTLDINSNTNFGEIISNGNDRRQFQPNSGLTSENRSMFRRITRAT